MVRHCTRCELRFPSAGELNEHLDRDHHAPSLDRYGYAPRPSQAPLYVDLDVDASPPRSILVVANQTLGAAGLRSVISERLAQGPAEVHVIAPATHSRDYPTSDEGAHGIRASSDEAGSAMARWRLRRTLADLAAAGARATGEIGPPDPYEAAGRFLEGTRVDEVVFSTLPPDVSRWAQLDVPARIRRRFGVPVTVVTAGAGYGVSASAAR